MNQIIMLGTGNATVTQCYNTCFLLETSTTRLLVDAGGGNGVLRQLQRAGVAIRDLHHLFVTHAHTDHVLGDVLINRPVIVPYRYAASYAVEAFVVLFFLAGIWMGRRSRFLWIALSWMGFDMIIHVVLGFGLNEVYIMSPHWLFVLPIAMAFALLRLRGRWLLAARVALMGLSVFLLAYNASLYVQYLFF